MSENIKNNEIIKIKEQAKLLSTPIDFDDLIKKGILEKKAIGI